MRAVIVLSILSIEIYSIPSTGLHVIKLRILALTKHFHGSSNTPTMKSSLQYCTNIAIRYDCVPLTKKNKLQKPQLFWQLFALINAPWEKIPLQLSFFVSSLRPNQIYCGASLALLREGVAWQQ